MTSFSVEAPAAFRHPPTHGYWATAVCIVITFAGCLRPSEAPGGISGGLCEYHLVLQGVWVHADGRSAAAAQREHAQPPLRARAGAVPVAKRRSDRRCRGRAQDDRAGEGAGPVALRPVRPPLPQGRPRRRADAAPERRDQDRGVAGALPVGNVPLAALRLLLAPWRTRRERPQVFVNVFGGGGRLSAPMSKRGWVVFDWDPGRGPAWDLAATAPAKFLRFWLRPGLVWGMHISAPFGPLQLPLKRRDEAPAPPHVASRRLASESVVRVCVSLVAQCRRDRVPVAITCDSASLFRDEPSVAPLRLLACVSDALVDSCQFGEPWRRRLRIQGHRVPASEIGGVPVGVRCSRTGNSHHRLWGRAPSGIRWSDIARELPRTLVPRLALALAYECGRLMRARMSWAGWGARRPLALAPTVGLAQWCVGVSVKRAVASAKQLGRRERCGETYQCSWAFLLHCNAREEAAAYSLSCFACLPPSLPGDAPNNAGARRPLGSAADALG